MADTINTLLMMVLRRHFKDHPEVLDRALKVIKDYTNKVFTQEDYDKTVNSLLVMMSDLPTNILHYFLTMVPLPKKVDNEEIPSNETMKNFEVPSAKDVQSILLNYLNNFDSLNDLKNEDNDNSKMSEKSKQDNLIKDPDFMVPNKRAKIVKSKTKPKEKLSKYGGINYECKKLIDICAEYVIANKFLLETYYKTKKEKAWNIVNNNLCDGDDLLKYYYIIKDLNKKTKWLRSIDDEDTLNEIIYEEYKESEIFLKEQHLTFNVDDNSFVLSEELELAISDFFKL